MNTTKRLINPIVDVCGKRTLEYLIECLIKFNRGTGEVNLRSIMGNISKAVALAKILKDRFDIEDSSINMRRLGINGLESPCLEIALKSQTEPGGPNIANYFTKSEFIEFPIYCLLLDSVFAQKGQLDISKHDGTPLITIIKSNWEMKCKSDVAEGGIDTLNSLVSAYYRCGLVLSPS